MKRLLLCIILAVALHAILLSADLSWPELAPQSALKSKSIALVLTAVQSQKRESQTDFTRMNQRQPQESTAENKVAEKQPGPAIKLKPQENTDGVRNPAPIRPKKNLKALTLKKQTIKALEPVDSASIAGLHFPLTAKATIGSPSNSATQPSGFPIAADPAFIKKTLRVPDEFSEPAATTAAVPATEAGEVLSESASLTIARPRYQQNRSPRYPLRARRMGYEGLVMLKVLVDQNGQVEDLELVSSSGHAVLDKAAIASVKKWMFEPGTEGGKKKKMWVKIPIRFELE